MKKCGVYKIEHVASGKAYIGGSTDMMRRWRDHRSRLRRRDGCSPPKLQTAWNVHGPSAFVFRPLLICAEADLLFYEQLVLDRFNAYADGFNARPQADSMLGIRHTPETIAKMSAAAIGRPILAAARAKIGDANRGRRPSPETRAKMRAAHLGKKHGPFPRKSPTALSPTGA